MNPNWLPAIATLAGLILNLVIFIYNLGRKSAMDRNDVLVAAATERNTAAITAAVAGLKEWMTQEFVTERLCGVRMATKVAA